MIVEEPNINYRSNKIDWLIDKQALKLLKEWRSIAIIPKEVKGRITGTCVLASDERNWRVSFERQQMLPISAPLSVLLSQLPCPGFLLWLILLQRYFVSHRFPYQMPHVLCLRE